MPKNRYKNAAGKIVSSVTTIIDINCGWNKRALNYWNWTQGRDGFEYMETAIKEATVGTISHTGVEADIKGEPFDLDAIQGYPEEDKERVRRCLEQWQRIKETVRFRFLMSEVKLVSENWQYGGQLDIIAAVQPTNMRDLEGPPIPIVPGVVLYPWERLALMDFKTSRGIYDSHIIQVGAYGGLWNENFPWAPIEEYHILHVGKDSASFQHRYYHPAEMLDPWTVFLGLLGLNKLRPKIKRMAA